MVKGMYSHHMLQEIHDEPAAVRLTVMSGGRCLKGVARTFKGRAFQRICLTGCGSSHFTGLIGKYTLEEFAKVPSSAVPALEFIHYASSVIGIESMVICISQSGETIETLKASRVAKERGAYVLGLTNNRKGALAKEANMTILTSAGIELGPGTKTVVSQMARIYQLALIIAGTRRSYSPDKISHMLSATRREIPQAIAQILSDEDGLLRALARKYKGVRDAYIIGSGPCFPCALQASNLFKEVASIHAEAFSVEEFRHGPLEILNRRSLVIAINPPGRGSGSLLRLMGRATEIGASILSLAEAKDVGTRKLSDDFIPMPEGFDEWQAPLLYLPPLQLLACYLAIEMGRDPDRFMNIRKTWTEE